MATEVTKDMISRQLNFFPRLKDKKYYEHLAGSQPEASQSTLQRQRESQLNP